MINPSSFLLLGKACFSDMLLRDLGNNRPIDEVWRKAFAIHGTGFLPDVWGDFAVALRDQSGRVLLAVDRFAIKTMCYRVVGTQLLFAERADDLADATTEVDPQAIFDYFYFHNVPSPQTVFKGIFRVPPGYYVLYEKGQLTVAPYWTPQFTEPPQVSFGDLRGEFRKLLEHSVTRQLDRGKPGCFLSGGTDSSTVAGMISQVTGGNVATYSIGFEAEGYDEMAFARIAAKHFGTEHHEYYVTPDDLVKSIPHVAASYDQPFGNSSALPAYYCARMAKENGVSRVLAGDGGDELFGGNSRYAKQRLFNLYRHVPKGIRFGLLEPIFCSSGAAKFPLSRKVGSYIEQARIPMPDRSQLNNLITHLGIDQVLSQAFLDSVNPQAPLSLQRQVWNAAITENPTNRELAFDWRFTLAESDLPKVCGTTRLAGIEVGFPMLDNELLDFSLNLPSSYKLNGLKLRWFFKEALRGFLPDEIITKKKQGFGLPFGVWLTTHKALRMLAVESTRTLADMGILRHDFVEALVTKKIYEHPGYYGEMVWISMMLSQWLISKYPGFRI